MRIMYLPPEEEEEVEFTASVDDRVYLCLRNRTNPEEQDVSDSSEYTDGCRRDDVVVTDESVGLSVVFHAH